MTMLKDYIYIGRVVNRHGDRMSGDLPPVMNIPASLFVCRLLYPLNESHRMALPYFQELKTKEVVVQVYTSLLRDSFFTQQSKNMGGYVFNKYCGEHRFII